MPADPTPPPTDAELLVWAFSHGFLSVRTWPDRQHDFFFRHNMPYVLFADKHGLPIMESPIRECLLGEMRRAGALAAAPQPEKAVGDG